MINDVKCYFIVLQIYNLIDINRCRYYIFYLYFSIHYVLRRLNHLQTCCSLKSEFPNISLFVRSINSSQLNAPDHFELFTLREESEFERFEWFEWAVGWSSAERPAVRPSFWEESFWNESFWNESCCSSSSAQFCWWEDVNGKSSTGGVPSWNDMSW